MQTSIPFQNSFKTFEICSRRFWKTFQKRVVKTMSKAFKVKEQCAALVDGYIRSNFKNGMRFDEQDKVIANSCYKLCYIEPKYTKVIRAYYEIGEEQGTSGMWWGTGQTGSKDFPLRTSEEELKKYFKDKMWADYRGKYSRVYVDNDELKYAW